MFENNILEMGLVGRGKISLTFGMCLTLGGGVINFKIVGPIKGPSSSGLGIYKELI